VGSVERLLRERLRIACIQLCCCLQEPVLSKNQCPSNPLLIRGPAQERQLKLFNSMLMHHPHDAMLHSIRKYKEDAYAPARRIPGIAQVYAHCTAQQLLYLHRRSTSAAYARMQHSSLGRMLCDSIAQCNRGPAADLCYVLSGLKLSAELDNVLAHRPFKLSSCLQHHVSARVYALCAVVRPSVSYSHPVWAAERFGSGQKPSARQAECCLAKGRTSLLAKTPSACGQKASAGLAESCQVKGRLSAAHTAPTKLQAQAPTEPCWPHHCVYNLDATVLRLVFEQSCKAVTWG